jgi:hypothetical protein
MREGFGIAANKRTPSTCICRNCLHGSLKNFHVDKRWKIVMYMTSVHAYVPFIIVDNR